MRWIIDISLIVTLVGLSYLSGYRAVTNERVLVMANCSTIEDAVTCTWTNDTGDILDQTMTGATWR